MLCTLATLLEAAELLAPLWDSLFRTIIEIMIDS